MRAMNHAHENLQRQGRACYKRKDYKRALEFFDWAIGRAPSVQLLDNRAACHEKLNDLPAALKDAKKAIQLQREDPTGYLRAGKVLLRMEKQSVGLEIYSHGLKSVKHVGQGYQVSIVASPPMFNCLSKGGENCPQLAQLISIKTLFLWIQRKLYDRLLGDV